MSFVSPPARTSVYGDIHHAVAEESTRFCFRPKRIWILGLYVVSSSRHLVLAALTLNRDAVCHGTG